MECGEERVLERVEPFGVVVLEWARRALLAAKQTWPYMKKL